MVQDHSRSSSSAGEDNPKPRTPSDAEGNSEGSTSNHVGGSDEPMIALTVLDSKPDPNLTAETEDSSGNQVESTITTDDVIEDTSSPVQVNTPEDSEDLVTRVVDNNDTTRNVDTLEERLKELEQRFVGELVLPASLFSTVQNKS